MEEKNWIKQAEADIKTSEHSLKSKDYYASIFWAQQAVEKSLKAVIIKHLKKLIKSHDLIFLAKSAKLPEDLLNKVQLFSGVYIETRYGVLEDDLPYEKFKEKDSSEFLKISKEVLKWSKKEI